MSGEEPPARCHRFQLGMTPRVRLRQQRPRRPPLPGSPPRPAAWPGRAGGTQGSGGTQPASRRGCRRQGSPGTCSRRFCKQRRSPEAKTHPAGVAMESFQRKAHARSGSGPGCPRGRAAPPGSPLPASRPIFRVFCDRVGKRVPPPRLPAFPRSPGRKPGSVGSRRPRVSLSARLCARRHRAQGRERRVAGTPPGPTPLNTHCAPSTAPRLHLSSGNAPTVSAHSVSILQGSEKVRLRGQ